MTNIQPAQAAEAANPRRKNANSVSGGVELDSRRRVVRNVHALQTSEGEPQDGRRHLRRVRVAGWLGFRWSFHVDLWREARVEGLRCVLSPIPVPGAGAQPLPVFLNSTGNVQCVTLY